MLSVGFFPDKLDGAAISSVVKVFFMCKGKLLEHLIVFCL